MKKKLEALFRRFVLFAQKIGANRERHNKRDPQAQFEWPYVKTKLQVLIRRFVPSERNVGANRERRNKADPQLKFEWPYVMNSSVPMLGPIVPGSWVWRRHHKHWHHGYYRVRR